MVPVDFSDPIEAEHAIRIGQAWIEMRRGAWTQHVRDFIFADDTGIEPGQMDALDLLSRRERTMKQLADRLRIDPSSATRAVQRLVAEGLAERVTAPDDGRVVIVQMTGPGRERHRQIASRRTTWMAVLLSEFDADERKQLTGLLERFVVSLDRSVDAIT